MQDKASYTTEQKRVYNLPSEETYTKAPEQHNKIDCVLCDIQFKSTSADELLNLLFEDDLEMLAHSKSVSVICGIIAKTMGFNQVEINEIKIAGLLHDAGKIEISESLLNKSEKLSDAEWITIMQHPLMGYELLKPLNGYARVAEFILEHHEQWDGSGYPNGLQGEKISLQARIIAAADAFDAMTSNRPYRKTVDTDEALSEILANAGTQFDPLVVKAMMNVFGQKALYA